jgi:hypothetical protein
MASNPDGKVRPSVRGLEVDGELELGRLLDGKLGTLGALQYRVDVGGGVESIRIITS